MRLADIKGLLINLTPLLLCGEGHNAPALNLVTAVFERVTRRMGFF